jgi:hypothetical protein
MHRLTFLRTLLGTPALLTLPPWELLNAAEQDRFAWAKECHRIFVYDGFVRGFQFHEGPRVVAQMKEHEELDLVREYDNEHDPEAVAVYWNGHKVGFLAMGENRALANLIDQGMLLSAYVAYTAPELEPWEQCFICVELLVPVNDGFDAYLFDYSERPDAGYKRHQHYGGGGGYEDI